MDGTKCQVKSSHIFFKQSMSGDKWIMSLKAVQAAQRVLCQGGLQIKRYCYNLMESEDLMTSQASVWKREADGF